MQAGALVKGSQAAVMQMYAVQMHVRPRRINPLDNSLSSTHT